MNTNQVREAKEWIDTLVAWIDAVPSDTVLPTMPGFDRDMLEDFRQSLAISPPVEGWISEAMTEQWKAMVYAPMDGTEVELLIHHRNHRYADDESKEDWEQIVRAKWIDFNDGGWTWSGLAGTPVGWRPLDSEGAAPSPSEAAVAAPVVPQGYALVPVEPTQEMRNAGENAWRKSTIGTGVVQAYAAMLAAAPASTKEPADTPPALELPPLPEPDWYVACTKGYRSWDVFTTDPTGHPNYRPETAQPLYTAGQTREYGIACRSAPVVQVSLTDADVLQKALSAADAVRLNYSKKYRERVANGTSQMAGDTNVDWARLEAAVSVVDSIRSLLAAQREKDHD